MSDAPTQLGSVVYCPLGTNQVTVALDTIVPSQFGLDRVSRGANHHVSRLTDKD